MDTIKSFFCLRDKRINFDLDPVTDAEFLFGEPQWAEDVDKRLQRSIVMGRPFRLVWWGQFGIGKTHRLRYMIRSIENKGYNFLPFYAVASDLDEKCGFERLHTQLIGSIGYDRLRTFAEQYLQKLNGGASIAKFEALVDGSIDVASAFNGLGSKNPNMAAAAWKYLLGQKLDRSEMQLANTGKSQIDTAIEFAVVHQVIGHIIEEETSKRPIYLVDEVENLTKIKNKNSQSRWQESIRTLLDVKNIGLVLAVGAESMQGIPTIIVMPDIVRRIQLDNYEQMAAYKAATAEKFVRSILEHFVDPTCRAAKEAANKWVDGVGDYESALYPFTKSGFQIFCGAATNDPKNAKPSEIINTLNNVAYEALTAKSDLITKAILEKSKIA
jgi:hypothetical protein